MPKALNMISKTIKNASDKFASLPGIGPRQAARIVSHLLKSPADDATALAESIRELKKKIRACPICFSSYEPTQSDQKTCAFCADKKRAKQIICVVGKETDIEPIEKTGLFKGVYHIVAEEKNYLDKSVAPSVKRLLERIAFIKKQLPQNKTNEMEIILALDATVEGDALGSYLEKLVKPIHVKISRLGRGLATGGELEYADRQTLSSALENRK